jgi:hypothetical protein
MNFVSTVSRYEIQEAITGDTRQKKSKKDRKNVVFAECHKMFRIARNVERGQGHWPIPYAFLITFGQKLPGTGSSRKYSMGSFNNIIQTTVRLSFNDISILC